MSQKRAYQCRVVLYMVLYLSLRLLEIAYDAVYNVLL